MWDNDELGFSSTCDTSVGRIISKAFLRNNTVHQDTFEREHSWLFVTVWILTAYTKAK